MKYITTILIIVLSIATPSLADLLSEPLNITVNDNWEVEYKGKDIQFYSIKRIKGESALLMFHKWPSPGSTEQIPHFLKQIADGMLESIDQQNPNLFQNDAYQKMLIKGEEFSGEAFIFVLQNALYHTIFMISDGNGIWNGQFSGSKSRWEEAVIILQQIKQRHFPPSNNTP